MAIGVNIPKRAPQGGADGNLMTLAGMGAGAFFGAGNPAAISAGGSIGGMVGGMAQGEQKAGPEAVPTSGDPMSRRMNTLKESPQMQIANSIDSLKYIEDPAQRAELAKPLMQADYMARNKRA